MTRRMLCSFALAFFSSAGSGAVPLSNAGIAQSSPAWKRITAPVPLHWPRDHGSHPEYETEWWYATGDLTDGSGRRFGYQLTIFRRGLDPRLSAAGESRLRPRHVFAGHLAIVDVAQGTLARADRVRRGCAGLAGADESELHAWVEDWRIDRAADGTIHLSASDVKQGLAVDLELEPAKPLVLHGERGLSQKSADPGNASMYASWTRLRTHGTLSLGRADGLETPGLAVSGESWFDHEFGSSQIGLDVAGWDWFGLRLSDGRDLMLYRLRKAAGESSASSAGTLVERDGTTRPLRAADFSLRPMAHWQSSLTRARYPIAWRIAVPSAGIDCEVAARVDACEFDARASVGTIYWEGPVGVTGSVEGSGYLELTGYAGSMAGRF